MSQRKHLMGRAVAASLAVVLATLASLTVVFSSAAARDAPADSQAQISLPTKLLENYVGTYKLNESTVITISRNGAQLFAQLTGQQQVEIFPTSEGEFFYKAVNAKITFLGSSDNPSSALLLHQSGMHRNAPRVSAEFAAQIAEQTSEKVANQKPTPGSDEALRRYITGLRSGSVNSTEISPMLLQATQQRMPKLQATTAPLGDIRLIKFVGVGNMGWDVYDVISEHGTSRWRILIGSNGVIENALILGRPSISVP